MGYATKMEKISPPPPTAFETEMVAVIAKDCATFVRTGRQRIDVPTPTSVSTAEVCVFWEPIVPALGPRLYSSHLSMRSAIMGCLLYTSDAADE